MHYHKRHIQPRLASRPGGRRRSSRCRSSRCRTPRRSRCTSSGRRSRLLGTRHRACSRSARGCRRRGCHRGCSSRCSRRGCAHWVCLARRSQGRSDACTAPKSATLDSGDAARACFSCVRPWAASQLLLLTLLKCVDDDQHTIDNIQYGVCSIFDCAVTCCINSRLNSTTTTTHLSCASDKNPCRCFGPPASRVFP